MDIHFTDIHSHYHTKSDAMINIYNCMADSPVPDSGWFSAGVHPWQLSKGNPVVLWESLQPHFHHSRLLAIGETGIDRLDPAPVSLQMEWFLRHLDLAEQMNLPLIIHNVRAHQDLIPVLKGKSLPVILHGYRGKPTVTAQWLQLPHICFSIGQVVTNPGPSVTESIKMIPHHRLFAETDDGQSSIESITASLASVLNIELSAMKALLFQNFKRIFTKYAPDT